MNDSQVTIKLTRDEALVLLHWLEEIELSEPSGVVEDPAVWTPVHRILGTLNKVLVEAYAPDYASRLDAARQRIRLRG